MLLSVLITAPQYCVLYFLAAVGLVLIFYGVHERGMRITTFSLGAILVSALVVVMCMRYRVARNLRRRLQETMKETDFAWQTMISPLSQHCPLFVRAHLVSNRDYFDNGSELSRQTSQIAVIVASDFYLASASRATSRRNVLRLKVRNIVGKSCCISTVSLLVKSNLSLEDVRTSIKSAGYSMHVIKHHKIPSSLALLAMFCERIEDDLMVQRIQATGARQITWHQINRVHSHEPVDRYTKSGKRLQREGKIDILFQHAQFINSLFHDELKELLYSFGDGCNFEPGPIKTPARALEKVVRRFWILSYKPVQPIFCLCICLHTRIRICTCICMCCICMYFLKSILSLSACTGCQESSLAGIRFASFMYLYTYIRYT